MANRTLSQKYHIVRITRDLIGSCLSDVSLVSSHTFVQIFLSCLGKQFCKFIPQECLPLVRNKVLCGELIPYRLV